jgi:hypothetical protein
MKLATVSELTRLLLRNGRWWLLPMVAVLLLTTTLLVVVQAIEYVAPFVYTIF